MKIGKAFRDFEENLKSGIGYEGSLRIISGLGNMAYLMTMNNK